MNLERFDQFHVWLVFAALLAQDRARWALAGDQLFVDLDLSEANLPPGTRMTIGTAVLEVVAQPHTGCRKFVDRFGLDAMKFVNSAEGRALHLRGLYAYAIASQSFDVLTSKCEVSLRRWSKPQLRAQVSVVGRDAVEHVRHEAS
jgi:hypothetical protein